MCLPPRNFGRHWLYPNRVMAMRVPSPRRDGIFQKNSIWLHSEAVCQDWFGINRKIQWHVRAVWTLQPAAATTMPAKSTCFTPSSVGHSVPHLLYPPLRKMRTLFTEGSYHSHSQGQAEHRRQEHRHSEEEEQEGKSGAATFMHETPGLQPRPARRGILQLPPHTSTPLIVRRHLLPAPFCPATMTAAALPPGQTPTARTHPPPTRCSIHRGGKWGGRR